MNNNFEIDKNKAGTGYAKRARYFIHSLLASWLPYLHQLVIKFTKFSETNIYFYVDLI